jgi:pilus assembly protein Flp/PilA
MLHRIISFWRRDEGATAVEYAVMLALIIMMAIGAVFTLGQSTFASFSTSNTELTTAGFGS